MCKVKYRRTGWYTMPNFTPIKEIVGFKCCREFGVVTLKRPAQPRLDPLNEVLRTLSQKGELRPRLKSKGASLLNEPKTPWERIIPVQPVVQPVSQVEPVKKEKTHRKYRISDYDVWSDEHVLNHLTERWNQNVLNLTEEDQACLRDERVISLIEYNGIGAL